MRIPSVVSPAIVAALLGKEPPAEARRSYGVRCVTCKVSARGNYFGTQKEILEACAADPTNSFQSIGERDGLPILACSRCRRRAAKAKRN